MTKLKYFILLTIAFGMIVLNGCEEDVPYDKSGHEIIYEMTNDTIVIGYNQVYYDTKNNFKLQYDSVVSDSRCPIGLLCFWEGEVSVRFDLIIGRDVHYDFVLSNHIRFVNDTIIENLKFRLADVLPYPVLEKEVKKEDYLAKIIFEKQ